MRKIATIDCETDPFEHGQIPVPFIWGYRDDSKFLHFESTKELVSYISRQDKIIYAHNGGRFDFHFLFEYMDKFRNFLIINGRIVRAYLGACELRDSYAIVPVALSKFEKMKFDYSKLKREVRHLYKDEIIKYLKSDCDNLFDLCTAFINRYGPKVTLASASIAECISIEKLDKKTLYSTKELYDRIKPFYHGGRVSAFVRGIIDTKTYIYDFNSAYPYAMTMAHPIGEEIKIYSGPINPPYDNQSFYIVDGYSDCCFPVNDKGKLYYPNSATTGRYYVTGWELNAALDTQSFVGKVLTRYFFPKTVNFQKYVEFYYHQKKTALPNSAEYIFAKLMLNSVYGKMAANPDNYEEYMLIASSMIDAANNIDGYRLVSINGEVSLVARPIPEEHKRFYNVATAASITGFVRAMLWRKIQLLRTHNANVYYCDTDSIITDKPLSTHTVENSSKEMGDLKLEQINDKLIIIAPKLYAARDIVTHKYKIASKGVELTAKDILSLANGNSVTYKRDAPTFSISHPPVFIERTLHGLNQIVDDYEDVDSDIAITIK